MRVKLRETGSIVVQADKDAIMDVLRETTRGAHVVAPDRLEASGSTYVLRRETDGTHVFHARMGASAVATASREREHLRREVQADLYELRRAVEARDR